MSSSFNWIREERQEREIQTTMQLLNAVMATRMLTSTMMNGGGPSSEGIPFGSVWWFVYAGISCVLVLFAGIMSGLTLGLMSLGLVELEILQRSGTPSEKKQAGLHLSADSLYYTLITNKLVIWIKMLSNCRNDFVYNQ